MHCEPTFGWYIKSNSDINLNRLYPYYREFNSKFAMDRRIQEVYSLENIIKFKPLRLDIILMICDNYIGNIYKFLHYVQDQHILDFYQLTLYQYSCLLYKYRRDTQVLKFLLELKYNGIYFIELLPPGIIQDVYIPNINNVNSNVKNILIKMLTCEVTKCYSHIFINNFDLDLENLKSKESRKSNSPGFEQSYLDVLHIPYRLEINNKILNDPGGSSCPSNSKIGPTGGIIHQEDTKPYPYPHKSSKLNYCYSQYYMKGPTGGFIGIDDVYLTKENIYGYIPPVGPNFCYTGPTGGYATVYLTGKNRKDYYGNFMESKESIKGKNIYDFMTPHNFNQVCLKLVASISQKSTNLKLSIDQIYFIDGQYSNFKILELINYIPILKLTSKSKYIDTNLEAYK